MDLLLLLKMLSIDDQIAGIVTVEAADANLWTFIDWHRYVIVLTNDNETLNHRSMILESDKGVRIVIDCVPFPELLGVTGVKNYDIKRLIAMGRLDFDRDGRILQLKQSITSDDLKLDEQILFQTFASFIDTYMRAKRCMEQGHELDAYQYVSDALAEWAKLSIYEERDWVRDSLWQQVKLINPGVSKLYEELIGSEETIAQRVELVLLACEFSITTNMVKRLAPLIQVLRESGEGLSIRELQNHSQLMMVAAYLPLIMDKLKLRGFVHCSYVIPDEPWNSMGLIPVYRWNEEREVIVER